MSPLSPFSPTFTSTSTTSRPRTDIDNLPELDIADPMDIMDGLEGVGVPDINDLFNFDEYDSANDSHSATTASPNRTPSPLLAPHSPVAIAHSNSPSFTYNQDLDFSFDSFDFMNPKEMDNAPAGPSSFPITPAPLAARPPTQDDVVVKQEPVDMWAEQPVPSDTLGILIDTAVHVQATPATMPVMALDSAINAQPDLINFNGLPLDQQQALQQLMFNIMSYQGKFGFDMAAPQQPFVPSQPTTIEPSMLFSNTNFSSSSSQSGFSSFVTPNSASALPSAGTSPFPNNAVAGPSSVPSSSSATAVEAEVDEDDQLVSIEPYEQPSRSVRADSAFSAPGDIGTRLDRLAPLSSIFSAGKGKGGKKGGGLSSVVRQEDEDVDDDDSWRPSPEEYKKLSSKEKRQLRNKLSARAFRNRRKDYIGTLEGHIRERDGVIDEMKVELGAFRSENQDLRKELAALKASTMGVLHPQSATDNASPAILQAFAMSANIPAPAATQAKKPAPTPVFNPRKDIGIDSKTRWGNENLFGGGSTICHTVLTTDTAKPAIAPFAMPRSNLNPRLAKIDRSNEIANLQSTANGRELGSAPFADWAENNAWSIRSMDSYRMQMWGRLAREAAADKAGLVGDLRPKFFTEPSSSSPKDESPVHVATTAAVKIASSFWSAFQTPSSKVDTDRLTAVVTGQSRRGNQSRQAEDDLIAALGGLRLQAGKEAGWKERTSLGVREDPLRALGGLFGLGMMPTRA